MTDKDLEVFVGNKTDNEMISLLIELYFFNKCRRYIQRNLSRLPSGYEEEIEWLINHDSILVNFAVIYECDKRKIYEEAVEGIKKIKNSFKRKGEDKDDEHKRK